MSKVPDLKIYLMQYVDFSNDDSGIKEEADFQNLSFREKSLVFVVLNPCNWSALVNDP